AALQIAVVVLNVVLALVVVRQLAIAVVAFPIFAAGAQCAAAGLNILAGLPVRSWGRIGFGRYTGGQTSQHRNPHTQSKLSELHLLPPLWCATLLRLHCPHPYFNPALAVTLYFMIPSYFNHLRETDLDVRLFGQMDGIHEA